MAGRDLTSGGARAVLCASLLVLLSCAMGNVLLAVIESVWWPLVAAVVWWGAAAGVVIPGGSGYDVQIENAPRGTGVGGGRSSSSSRMKWRPPP